MLKWILIVLGVLVLAAAIVAAVGAFLPQQHVASRSARLARPPDAVFAVIHDVAGAASWRSDLTRVEMLPPVEGRVRFREEGRSGAIVMEIAEATPPVRMVTRIADPDLAFGGTWTFELESDGTGTRLTITERGEIYNVVFRMLARFVFGYTATIETYLEALETKVGKG